MKSICKSDKKKLKSYNLYWTDEVNKSITIKAESEEEAREQFNNGNINFDEAEEGDINFAEGSLEIEEAE